MSTETKDRPTLIEEPRPQYPHCRCPDCVEARGGLKDVDLYTAHDMADAWMKGYQDCQENLDG